MGMESVYRLSVVLGMTDNLTKNMSSVQGNVDTSVGRMNSAFGTMQKAGAALTGIGGTITGVALTTVKATFDTQDALGELSSLGVEDLKAVEKAAKSFSDTWAGTSKADFITASYDIKSGIASLSDEGVAQFTQLAALTGKATKSTTEEMGSLFATGYGIYKGYYNKMSDLEFGEMFSAGISTAVKAYKTSGSGMASAISMLGATATNANVPMEEQLAILGQLQTTMSGSEAATKYKSFLNQAAKAGETLKLKLTDNNNQLLSTPEILKKLKTKYGETIDAVEKRELKEAFGTDEAVAMIDLLYKNVGSLETGINDLGKSMKNGVGVTEEMAEAINNTPAQKFQVLKQQVHNNVEELGNHLLPTINKTMDKVNGLIQKGSDWISKNQETVDSIMNIGLKLGVVLIVLGLFTTAVGTAGKVLSSIKMVIHGVKAAMALLNTAFVTTPVGWVVIAIVGLIAAFVLLWNKCEEFRNFWIELFGKIKNAVTQMWSTLQPALANLGQKLLGLYEAVKPILKIVLKIGGVIATVFIGQFVGAIKGVLAALTPLTNAIGNLVSFVTNVVNAIVALFKGDFSGAIGFAKNAVGDLKDFFVNAFSAITDFIGGFADGFLDVVGGALSAVGSKAKGAIDGIKGTVQNGLEKVKGFFGNIMEAAGGVAKEKLSNIQNAYQSHGGGIKGATFAALEGVKGVYSSGMSFVDKLTGGKLSNIKNKFTSGLSNIKSTVSNKMSSIKEAFGNKLSGASKLVKSGIEKIKNFFKFDWSLPKLKMPHFSITGKFSLDPPSIPKIGVKWYAQGGIMTKPTFFGTMGGKLLGGGEAGHEAILPLSALWGKLKEFIHVELNADDEERTIGSTIVQALTTKKELRKVENSKRESNTIDRERGASSKKTVIEKLNISVDISKIKDLPMLYKLLDELKDAQNSTDEDDPVTA